MFISKCTLNIYKVLDMYVVASKCQNSNIATVFPKYFQEIISFVFACHFLLSAKEKLI